MSAFLSFFIALFLFFYVCYVFCFRSSVCEMQIFPISSSGGAQVCVKKIIGLQGNADNSSKIDYL